MPEISVIMPVYNAQSYLNQSIHSVLHQSFSDFELILINDGSADYSLLYCNALAKKDSRIRVIDLPHDGVATARAEGIRAAKGNYISFVDADDLVEKDYLQHLYTAIIESNADIAMCRAIQHAADTSEPMDLPVESGVYSGSALASLKQESLFCGKDRKPHFSFTYLWDKLFCAGLLRDNIRYMDKRAVVGTDTLLSTACFLDSKCFTIIDAVDYNYFMRADSICHSQRQCSMEKNLIKTEFFWKALVKIMKDKGYSDLVYKADALTIYHIYPIVRYYEKAEIHPICGELKDLIRAQSENDGCDRWAETVKTLKGYIE